MTISIDVKLQPRMESLPDGWTAEKYFEMWRASVQSVLDRELNVAKLDVTLSPNQVYSGKR